MTCHHRTRDKLMPSCALLCTACTSSLEDIVFHNIVTYLGIFDASTNTAAPNTHTKTVWPYSSASTDSPTTTSSARCDRQPRWSAAGGSYSAADSRDSLRHIRNTTGPGHMHGRHAHQKQRKNSAAGRSRQCATTKKRTVAGTAAGTATTVGVAAEAAFSAAISRACPQPQIRARATRRRLQWLRMPRTHPR